MSEEDRRILAQGNIDLANIFEPVMGALLEEPEGYLLAEAFCPTCHQTAPVTKLKLTHIGIYAALTCGHAVMYQMLGTATTLAGMEHAK